MKLAVGAEEKLHIAYGIFMVAFYIAGSYKHNNKLMGIQLFLFIAFVICQFFYNQLNELYKIFSINEGKSEFPARRILLYKCYHDDSVCIVYGYWNAYIL